MEIIRSDRGGVRVLRIVGSFDHGDVAALAAEVEQALADGRPRIVVDAELLRFIASVGVGALLQARLKLCESGGDLVLARPPELARKIVEVLGLEEVLPCAELEAALERVAAGAATPEPARDLFDLDRACAALFPPAGHAGAEEPERPAAGHPSE